MVIALDLEIFITKEERIRIQKRTEKRTENMLNIHTLLCKLAEECKNKKGIYIY